jgi:ribosomal protein L11 methyltransferase
MQTIKLIIQTDGALTDALSDYLIGAFDAAVEFQASGTGMAELHGFLQPDDGSAAGLVALRRQVEAYGADLAAVFNCPAPAIHLEEIDNQDWAEHWKEHFKAFEIVPGLVIAPTWESYQADGETKVLRMDPGMAFGTGQHETTRLCLQMLREPDLIGPETTLLDVGTGTGILGMAALLFGAARVVAIDNDEEAVKAALVNAELNRLSEKMAVSSTPLAELSITYRVVVANIVHDVLLELADDLVRVVQPGGMLVLSGLIEGEQSTNIARVFAEKRCQLIRLDCDGQWAALQLRKS